MMRRGQPRLGTALPQYGNSPRASSEVQVNIGLASGGREGPTGMEKKTPPMNRGRATYQLEPA